MVKNRLNSYAKYAFLNAYPLNDDPTKIIFYKAGYSFFPLNFVVNANFYQTNTDISPIIKYGRKVFDLVIKSYHQKWM